MPDCDAASFGLQHVAQPVECDLLLNDCFHQLFLLCSGLHETLHMTVAIPLLWGIPPRHETLRYTH